MWYSQQSNSIYSGDRAAWQDIELVSNRPSQFHWPVIRDGAHTGEWIFDEAAQRAASIPDSVTKRQARQELLQNNKLDAVQAAIDAIQDPIEKRMMQIYWDESTEYQLNHPELQAMAQAIGLTQTQLEDMFISASQR